MPEKTSPTAPVVAPNHSTSVLRDAAPLRRQVIELLRQDLAARIYKPGERLSEKTLCDRYSVSRTVVREALRQVEAEGLVRAVPNRGPTVAVLTRQDAQNLCEVRLLLEPKAAQFCAERASTADKERLSAAFAQIVVADATGNTRDLLAAGAVFYSILADATGNQELAALLRVIYVRLQMLRGAVLQSGQHHEQPLKELQTLVRSIHSGNGTEAAAASARHVLNVSADVLRTFEADQPADKLVHEPP